MTRSEAIKAFFFKSVQPVIVALILYCIFKSACMKNGEIDYVWLWILCGPQKKTPYPVRIGGAAAGRFSYFRLCATATATATVAPTMGLLPMPKKPIISTWAGTEEEPANCASECIRPMVSVMP